MKKHFYLFLTFAGITCYSYAQRAEWVGTQDKFQVSSSTVYAQGNLYVFGIYSHPIIIGNDTIPLIGNGAGVAPDCAILKFDSTGNYVWSKVFGGSSHELAEKIVIDDNGNIVVSAFVQSTTVMSDTSYISSGPHQLIKFSANGNFMTYHGNSAPYTLATDGTNFYAATNEGIYKFDSDLNIIWQKLQTPGFSINFSSVAFDQSDIYVNNNVLVVSGIHLSNGSVTVDTVTMSFSLGQRDEAAILKMDTSGSVLWARTVGGSNYSVDPRSVFADDAGNVYAAIEISGNQMVIDTITLTNPMGTGTMAIIKWDANGNLLWASGFYASNTLDAYDITADGQDLLISIGYHHLINIGGSTLPATTTGNGAFIKLDAGGNVVWVKAMENTNGTSYNVGLNSIGNGIYLGAMYDFGNAGKLGCFEWNRPVTPMSAIARISSLPEYNPVALFSFTPLGNNEISFTNQSVDATTWLWDFGDGNTSTLQNPTHTYATSDTFTVTLIASLGICTDTFSTSISVVVGIENHLMQNLYSVYSNPSTNELYVNCNETMPATGLVFRLFNLTGQEIYHSKLIKGLNKVPTADISPGIYVYKISSGNIPINVGKIVVGGR